MLCDDLSLDLGKLKVTITGGMGSTVYHAPDLLGVAVLNGSNSQPTQTGNVISGNDDSDVVITGLAAG